MADTINAVKAQVWSKALYAVALLENWFKTNGLMGKGVNNIVELKSDLQKENGEKETFQLLYNLEGEGVNGDDTLEENEEALETADFDVFINQKRNAVRTKGRLDDKKAAVRLREYFKGALSGWLQELIVKQIFLKLCGINNTGLKDINGKTYAISALWSNTPNPVPSANIIAGSGPRYFNSAGGALSAITAADIITPQMITYARIKAETAARKILPLDIKGGKFYVMLVHPYQMSALKTNAIILDGFKDAAARGDDNPIFKGGDTFLYDGVIVKSHPAAPYLKPADVSGLANFEAITGTGTQAAVPIARAVLCGRQAAAFAQCDNKEGWQEKTFDYGNKSGVATGLLGGIAKTAFKEKGASAGDKPTDFAVITVDTAAPAPTI
jgi:N4-gp56 family major capsid protein